MPDKTTIPAARVPVLGDTPSVFSREWYRFFFNQFTQVVDVPHGGTGLSTLEDHSVLIGAGTAVPTFVAPGVVGNVLVSDGTDWISDAGGAGATISNDTTTATPLYPLFANATSGAASAIHTSSPKYTYTPNTGTLLANRFTTGALSTKIGESSLLANTTGVNNTAVGVAALINNTEGDSNVAVGYQTLAANITGSSNVAIGLEALPSNTSGNDNVAIGAGSLSVATTASANVCVGSQAGESITTTSGNTAVGNGALASADTNFNTAIGCQALQLSAGGENTAVGFNALAFTSVGNQNVAVGVGANQNNGIGNNNIAIGYNALTASIDTSDSVAVGSQALTANSIGYGNTAIGTRTLLVNEVGNNITAVGFEALTNTTVDGSTAVGYLALTANTTGIQNTAVGTRALRDTTTGQNNTALGFEALMVNTGDTNTGIGERALTDNTTGHNNTAVGELCLRHNIDGYDNTAVGSWTGWALLSGRANTMIGRYAGGAIETGNNNVSVGVDTLTTAIACNNNVVVGNNGMRNGNCGDYNVAIGDTALYETTGAYNIALGAYAGLGNFSANANVAGTNNIYVGFQTVGSGPSNTNEMVIGDNAVGLGSNTTVLGNTSTTDTTVYGNLLLPTAPLDELQGGTGTATYTTGDILYASATNTLSKLTAGTVNYVLTSGGAGVAPSWAVGGGGGATLGANTFTGSQTISGANSLLGSYGAGGVTTNFAAGDGALASNVTSANNIAIGKNTLTTQTTGANNNIAIGLNALTANTNGQQNLAIGSYALYSNTYASNNTAIGYRTLLNVTSGYQNVGIGGGVLPSCISGSYNTGVGCAALDLSLGSNNTSIGWLSLSNVTSGNNNVGVGSAVVTANVGDSNSIVIGANAVGLGSNTTVLGNSSTTATTIYGNLLLPTAPLGSTQGGTGTATYTTGDILYASATNVLSKLAVGTNTQVLTLAGGVPTWAAGGAGSGTVTSVSIVTANGISGTVATPTTTPAITLSLTKTGTSTTYVTDTSPTLITPALGTPTALVGTNITGTASGLTAGAATALATARTIAGVSFDGSANIAIPLANLSDVTLSTPISSQVLGYNGSAWVNVAGASAGAGTGVVFYNATPIISASGTQSNVQIATLATIPVVTAEQTVTGSASAASGAVLFSAFVSAALNRTIIDAGVWDFTSWIGLNSVNLANTVTRQVYTAIPFVTGTVTMTGTGTTRTATASGGTPFATGVITASSVTTDASYLQTPSGLYQIITRTSDTVVTISNVPTTYTNESAVAGTVWKKLFGVTTGDINDITPDYGLYEVTVTAASYAITTATKVGILGFFTSASVLPHTVTITYNGTTRNTHVNTPLANLHNELAGLNGGAATEYYHSTLAEYTGTGTGVFVRATSPTLVTPALGTPTALVGTNITGTATAFTASNVTTNANLTGGVTSVGNAATVVTNANLTGGVTSVGNAATVVTNANLTGEATSTGNAVTLANSAVIGKVITGYVSGAGTVAATDSILQAIQKLDGNNSTNANLTGPITSVGNATSIASQTGTGTKFVVDTSPTLITPALGTPTTLVGTNITGTAAAFNINGTVGATTPTTGSFTTVAHSAGTTAIAPIKLTSGTNLTAAVAGAAEYDGTNLYFTQDTTQGRGVVPTCQQFYLASAGTAFGATIAPFFGANSAISLDASSVYYIEAFCFFLKTTSGTATWTHTISSAATLAHAIIEYTPVTGFTTTTITGSMVTTEATQGTSTALVQTVTSSLTTAVNHIAKFKVQIVTNAACNYRLNLTQSAGTVTPQAGSYYKVTRVGGTAGNFVA